MKIKSWHRKPVPDGYWRHKAVFVFGAILCLLAKASPAQVPDPVFSIESGLYTNDSLTLALSLSGAPPGSAIHYVVNPAGSTNLPTTNSPVYTGPITFNTNLLIKARAFPPADANMPPSQIVAGSYIFLDDTDADFTSNLPLIIISTQGHPIPVEGQLPDGRRAEGTLAVIDTQNGRSSLRKTPQFQGQAGFQLFGTDVGFPKPELRFETHDANGGSLAAPLLDFPADAQWFLEGPFNDKTLLNGFLAAELHEKMGHYAVRRRFVEVFADMSGGRLVYPQDYLGVYLLLERIEVGTNRVNIQPLSSAQTSEPDISGGYVIRKDFDSHGDLNFQTKGDAAFLGQSLKVVYPEPKDLRVAPALASSWPGPGYTASASNQLSYLVGYLNLMEKALYATNWLATNVVGTTNHYSSYLDADSFVDYHWLTEFSKYINGYRLGNYMSKDRGGKLKMEPIWMPAYEGLWALSFGNGNYLRGGTTNGWYYSEQDQGITSNEHIWLRRLINGSPNMGTALPDNSGNAPGPGGDPDFNQKIADRWSVLRTNVLNGTNLLQEIDQLSTMLNEAALRDTWGPAGKYRSQLVGVYQWPIPDGNVNSTDSRDVDYVHPTNYLGNATNSIIGQMKKWVMGRYLWIDAQFTPQPTFSASGGLVTNGSTVTITPPSGATLYYTLDGTDPRLQATPTLAPGGSVSPSAVSVNGPTNLTINSNVRIFARAQKAGVWYNTWSGPAALSLFTAIPSLRITEIMYHPAPPPAGSPYSTEDFEFIEVKNIGNSPLNINQFSIGGSVQFTCPDVILTNGQTAVVVANLAAFLSRYGPSTFLVLGAYAGSLNNSSHHLSLSGALHEGILDFSYQENWYPATDGFGFSLVAADEAAPTSAWNLADNWRPSSAFNGSPGQTDPPPPPRPAVIVNEILTHADSPASDYIELYNTTGADADISDWFLTDDFNNPKKYVLPPTIIPAGGFVVLYQTNSFGANGANSFDLSAEGGQVYLFSGNGADLTGYAHGFSFGPAPAGVTFGRYVTSAREEHFVAQRANTPGAVNAGPLVGPVVASELNYHPPDIPMNGIGFSNSIDEYIELQNITATSVTLYDVNYPSNTWHLRNAVEYDFPTGANLPPNGFLLVVGFDPLADPAATAGFRARNYVPDDTPLYGPWRHSLDDSGASVELTRPGVPAFDGVPYILVDRVNYSNTAPWPVGAGGTGLTLQRIVPSSYGDDPTNWFAAAPSPGDNFIPSGIPPTLVSQPGDRLVPSGTDVLLTASATGTAPLRYQWRYNDQNLPGANSSTLVLTNFQFSQAGIYNLFVYNNGGAALGTNFTLGARVGLKITSQPLDRFATNGATTNFTLLAIGTGTLQYQWRLNGVQIPNATTNTLIISNVQAADQGAYDCVVKDDYDTNISRAAILTLITRPVFTQHPASQTAVVGGSVSLTVSASGTTPLGFRWRSPITLTNGFFSGYIITGSNYSVLVLTNLQFGGATNYSVVVTNIVGYALGGPQTGLSSNAVLTVLADSDMDGLPDVYQIDHPNVSGAGDEDHDGMSNAAEYFAGTDPFDATSNLKVFLTGGGAAAAQFNAVSNRSYTVQYTDGLHPIRWQKLGDVLARNTTRTETVADPNPRTNRFYRIVTPIQP